MKRLTAREIEPKGWIKRQLEIQAAGLAGNLDRVWPDVKNSKWIGGNREGWERVPYWLDGFIPLAYLLKDDAMIARAKRYVDKILERQCTDGWLCPCAKEERKNYDVWALFLLLKVLVVWEECSKDGRIESAVYRALKQYRGFIRENPPSGWAGARWYECLVSVLWLFERRPEPWLKELVQILRVSGTDFSRAISLWHTSEKQWSMYMHVVNAAMALKAGPLYRRVLFGKDVPVGDADAENMFRTLEKYHGTAAGHFNGDVCLSENDPIHGTELCGVVEAMYSYEWLLALTGKSIWGDRLEKLAFNALPAAVSPDMWAHQYDQMVNQIECSPQSEPPVFHTNTADAHIFGLEPNFGCCTANFGQGFPKLVLSAFLLEGEDTVVSAVLLPSSVCVKINGRPVNITLDTEYPFRGRLRYTVDADAEFALKIRIPGSACGFAVNGEPKEAKNGWYIVRRRWARGESLAVDLRFEARLVPRHRRMYVLERGPLLFSLAIEERWEKQEYTRNGTERRFPYCDYYIYPESKWNYAFCGGDLSVREKPFRASFSPSSPPLEIETEMAEIDWGYAPGQAGVCRKTPKSRAPISAPVKKRFIPYGCTNLRMTEMPLVQCKEKNIADEWTDH